MCSHLFEILNMLTTESMLDIAFNSPAKQHKVSCACYDKRGRLISTAWNMPKKSHPIQAKYAELAGMSKRINLHAEILALIRAKEDVYTIQVVRTSRERTPKASFPCKICMGYILDTGVQEIVFHNIEGLLTTERL